MIEALKIEDFVIEQLFLPYMPSLKEMCHEYGIKYRGRVSEQKIVERNLRRNPELIIHFLNENLETKERVFSAEGDAKPEVTPHPSQSFRR